MRGPFQNTEGALTVNMNTLRLGPGDPGLLNG